MRLPWFSCEQIIALEPGWEEAIVKHQKMQKFCATQKNAGEQLMTGPPQIKRAMLTHGSQKNFDFGFVLLRASHIHINFPQCACSI
jgi:hypothetical protein